MKGGRKRAGTGEGETGMWENGERKERKYPKSPPFSFLFFSFLFFSFLFFSSFFFFVFRGGWATLWNVTGGRERWLGGVVQN